jgi:hypothetical protein
MIHICTSGHGNRSVLRRLQAEQVRGPQTFCTKYTCPDGSVFGGELVADDWEEAELVARALGVTVVGRLIGEVETDGVEEQFRETKDGRRTPPTDS